MKKRIALIDYLKAICVILVIVTHYDWAEKNYYIFTMFINMAVPVFMILSGYNFAMSYKKKSDGSIKKMYSREIVLPKLDRFLFPYIIVCFIELLIIIIQGKHINLSRLFLEGAYGPGSYYVPIMIQLLAIFPLIFWCVEKDAKRGVIFMGIINMLYEITVVLIDMDIETYRLCIGRYIFLIALGCYIYTHPERRVKTWQLISMLAIGLCYIVLILEKEHDLPIFPYWRPTVIPIAFYIFPIVILLFRGFYHCSIAGVIGDFLSFLGQASYHVFLVQMVYYHFELGGAVMRHAWYIAIPYNLLATITVGCIFYKFEDWFRKKKYPENIVRSCKRLYRSILYSSSLLAVKENYRMLP